ncbi:MAG: AAA family ATPase, partial [Desulfovibrionaceae bacterium]
MAAEAREGFVLWFTGLPGSGKSTLARRVAEVLSVELAGRVGSVKLLEMDARRKAWFPEPEYTEAERERAYGLLAEEAAALARLGCGVVLDGTAHRKAWRDAARAKVAHF